MNEEKPSFAEALKDMPGKKINPDGLKLAIIVLVGFAVIVLAFGAGMIVGGMKARFSYRWAENYHKNFAGPKNGFLDNWQGMPPLPGDFIEGHGVFGEIIELEGDGFVVKGAGDMEKIIIVAEDTVIKKGMETIKDGLKVGDRLVIIGSPNEQGQIEAKLIRIFNKEPAGPLMPYRGSRFLTL